MPYFCTPIKAPLSALDIDHFKNKTFAYIRKVVGRQWAAFANGHGFHFYSLHSMERE